MIKKLNNDFFAKKIILKVFNFCGVVFIQHDFLKREYPSGQKQESENQNLAF